MKMIQVDMFSVGLGSASLVQFALKNGDRVTVLADAGMGSGHQPEEVLTKLPDAFQVFRTSKLHRIDLIVGTHYGGDHLKGLVPIIKDESIEIGEIWLPPIKRDDQEILGSLEDDDFFAELLFDDQNGSILYDYLLAKAYQLEELADQEHKAIKILTESNRYLRLPHYSLAGDPPESAREFQESLSSLEGEEAISAFEKFFVRHQSDACARTNFRPAHESAVYDSRNPSPLDIVREVSHLSETTRYWGLWQWGTSDHWPSLFASYPARARTIPAALAAIRESTASNAITAIHLNEVIQALRSRESPIRPRCQSITGDRPSRFAWVKNKPKLRSA